ncbi:MAG: 1-acyl-sn-glycerol-3-phosphate acyltransferase, partial [Candidatus Omnitrophica bacterium]|nr:1-acyl-sn-glycerol-3-phosphate acyltransferase [Candidatus Omnitrophota bacterium]
MSFIITKEDLPRTRLGKIKRYEVEKSYKVRFEWEKLTRVPGVILPEGTQAAGEAAAEKSAPEDLKILNSEIGKKAIGFLAEEKGIKRVISPNDHLELDLGIDSLGRVELAVGLEKIFNIEIPEEYMAKIFTVKDLILGLNELILKKIIPNEVLSSIPDEATWKVILTREPKERIKGKIDLSPNAFSKCVTLLGIIFLRVIFKVFFRIKSGGTNDIPKSGPFILCPNHSSYLDAFVVAASVPYMCELNLFFLGFREYFIQPVIRNMVKLMRVVPVDPAAELINALQVLSFIIKNKKSLCIFPEGQRSIDGNIKEFKKGIGILAKELSVPLIPVYIEGTFNAWPRGKGFPRPYPIKIIFGKPFDNKRLLEVGKAIGAKDDYEAIAVGLREQVFGLKVKNC